MLSCQLSDSEAAHGEFSGKGCEGIHVIWLCVIAYAFDASGPQPSESSVTVVPWNYPISNLMRRSN